MSTPYLFTAKQVIIMAMNFHNIDGTSRGCDSDGVRIDWIDKHEDREVWIKFTCDFIVGKLRLNHHHTVDEIVEASKEDTWKFLREEK